MTDNELEKRFLALETKMAFLEDFLNRLQAEVVGRDREAELRKREFAAVKEKVLQVAAALEDVPDRKPPHY